MKRILTAAALAAALLSSAPRAAAACPYKVGPLGRSAPRSGAGLLALALIRSQRFQLATFQHGTACAGGAPSGAFLSRRRRGQILHFTG